MHQQLEVIEADTFPTLITVHRGVGSPDFDNPQVSLLLDYSVAEDYQAVNELLNVFAQAYPGTSYNDETPITDPAAAQKAFDRYKKCERIYARCYHNGTPIRQLTVAA